MGKYTPALEKSDKEEYITAHLFNELHWLLHAATEWQIQEDLKLNLVGYNMQNYAMDSAFLHARSLFEFFLGRTTNHYYGCDQFLGSTLVSADYTSGTNSWKGPLHSHLMHAQDRSRPRQLQSPDGPKDLNQMPVYFANEILSLWKQFEQELGTSGKPEDKKLEQLARDKRKEAISNAVCVVNSDSRSDMQ
jgi:hypothetical protein